MSFIASPIKRCWSVSQTPCLAVACLVLCGCQTWQLSDQLPGSGLSKKEKQIVERVANDPFPSPEQVGIGSK